jgi:hypothetical protein
VVPSVLDPLAIYCDNTGAIANVKEPRSHKNFKHIKHRYHSIRDYVKNGELNIFKVHTVSSNPSSNCSTTAAVASIGQSSSSGAIGLTLVVGDPESTMMDTSKA